jgi:hypothetical protein
MQTVALKFFALLFATVAVFFIGYAGNAEFTPLQSFGSMFIGLVTMTIAGILGALTSTPTTE